jgi:hypothetical protein
MDVIQWALHSETLHFGLYIFISAVISGMPAPTANSSVAYCWTFKTFNILAANISRATNTTVEKSPNFQDALNTQQAQQNQRQTTVIQPTTPPNPPTEPPLPPPNGIHKP